MARYLSLQAFYKGKRSVNQLILRYSLLLVLLFIVANISYLFAAKKAEDIRYIPNSTGKNNLLDVYYPRDSKEQNSVLIFIHGGAWNSGKKETYWWLGRNMANKNVVTVVINYTLSPEATYPKMASECASAVKWVQSNIAQYGGNPDKIFLMGHSAGGHLAALIDADPQYFKSAGISNPVKGVILNDTFGLDMFEYLGSAEQGDQTNSFLYTFSKDKETWKKGSPLTYFQNVKSPYLIFTGEKTYPSIKMQSERISKLLIAKKIPTEHYIIKNKKHVAMIGQMVFGWNSLYKYITTFINKHE